MIRDDEEGPDMTRVNEIAEIAYQQSKHIWWVGFVCGILVGLIVNSLIWIAR